jgi:Flp pilus assembly pilin Flp
MKLKSKRGQAMAEYIIIVVVVALAALAIFGVFSDRLRALLAGASEGLGAPKSETAPALDPKSTDFLKRTGPSGN